VVPLSAVDLGAVSAEALEELEGVVFVGGLAHGRK